MRITAIVFLFAIATMANSSLLEMSQTLWTKVLEGGLTKIGALDPLRVPVVKVDQSEGNTSYRMILRGVQIIGLNDSTLESVHIGRGRLKTNLSEHEAGYVSYTDQKELDTIRYRFHTVVKEPKVEQSQNLEVKSIPDIANSRDLHNQRGRIRIYDRTNYESRSRYQKNQQRVPPQGHGASYEYSSRYQDNQQRAIPQGQRPSDEPSSRYQDNQQPAVPQGQRPNYESSSRYQDNQQRAVPQGQRPNYESSSRYQDNQQRGVPQGHEASYESSSRYQDDQQRAIPQGHGPSYQSSSRYQDNQQRAIPQGQRTVVESSSRYQDNQQRVIPQRQETNVESSSRYQDNQQRVIPQGQRPNYASSPRYQDNHQGHRSNYESSRNSEDQRRYYTQSQNSKEPFENAKADYHIPQRQESSSAYPSSTRSFDNQQNARYAEDAKDGPSRVRIVYAESLRYPEDNTESKNQRPTNNLNGLPGCGENCQYRRTQQGHSTVANNQRDGSKKNGREDEIGVAASMNFESRRAYVDARISPSRDHDHSADGPIRQNSGPNNDNRYAANFEEKSNVRGNERNNQEYTYGTSSRLENQPGYVDIVYADEKDHRMRHFGNLKVETGKDRTVYSLDDVLRDLRDHKRFVIHNFTEGEALTKKNDAVRTASETKRIKDMVRYAKDHQEKQGYYEQGMQLIYHYGEPEDYESSNKNQTKRNKRAHLDETEETEDDVMHVIMRIRVPMLRVNAGYVLMGKVGKQVLRGNGLLAGNFTELIGDFTLELKKIDNDTMIVRAARARLTAKSKNITLQGMNEEGPVKEILTHGLMAAEAVAAMLADDLTTKALSEKTADSIIYKMYKNLPVENY